MLGRVAPPREEVARLSDFLFAAAAGEVETVRQALTQGGVGVNAVDYEGRSAVMIAATSGNLHVVEFLIEQRAALNLRDTFGKTALANALQRGHLQVADSLNKAGAQLEWSESTRLRHASHIARARTPLGTRHSALTDTP